jgi:hypothetical protein
VSRIAILICSTGLMIAACAELPIETDLVKDPDVAIRIAQNGCVSPKVEIRETDTWHAELRNGFWHVWVSGNGSVCRHHLDTKERASDGRLDDACVECVP